MDFEMPRPGPEHEKLAALCGQFTGDETMMPSPWSPEQQERTCTISARMLESFFVISDMVFLSCKCAGVAPALNARLPDSLQDRSRPQKQALRLPRLRH